MAPRLIIHIGMHKTGSSSIQRFLSRNRIALRAFGVLYPPSRGADGRRQSKHNALFTAISHEADTGRPHPQLGPSADIVRALGDRIAASGAGAAVLSAEGLSGERPDFAQALAPLADRFEARIVVFLRRPDLWVESFYRQMVMSEEVREARPLSAFLEAPETLAHLDYERILGWWADRFGAAALRVGRFAPERDRRPPTTLFLKAAGLSPAFGLLPWGRAHVNAGPSATVVEERRLRNASIGAAASAVVRDPSGGRLTDAERDTLLEATAPALRRIRNAYPLVESGPSFT